MRRLILALCFATSPLAAQSSAAALNVSGAGWLAGCWELRAGARVTQEQWMAPLGGAMLGMSRTVVRDTVREWEHLVIGERDGSIAYSAKPSRQAETVFPATQLSDSLLVFENLAHDFPQRILYRRRGADSVIARIEGPRNGQTRGIDFPMRRVACH
jgi:hypothetical protein